MLQVTSLMKNKYVRRGILVVFDAIVIILSHVIAQVFLTSNFNILNQKMLVTSIVAVCVYIIIFLLCRVYKSITEYTGAREYTIYLMLSVLSGLVSWAISNIIKYETCGFRTNILAALLVAGVMVMSRVCFRFLIQFIETKKVLKGKVERILIIGAGNAGLQIIRDLLPRLDRHYKIVGIIDDNVSKQKSSINGVDIIGGREKIIWACDKYDVDVILFAIANIDKKEKIEILNICNETKAQVKVIPDMKEILYSNKPIKINQFKDIQIEDLLGRDPIRLENDAIASYIKDKIVLVTGGGGSIGSELCRQIASFGARELLMVDIYENTLYETELEIRKKYPELNLTAIVASVRDSKRINEIFEKYKPEIVFHAAAHKHVPLMETSPIEAIKNNVFGTYNVVKAADNFNIDKFILVSTDKAVNPTSIMGATKRICEMIIQMQNSKSKTNYVAVRFGNVLGSHGSVIPIFKKQIASGGPVTVTHKDITRYFMTIPEAVGLILQAITFAEGGEIFVLDMGEPVKIYDLAEKMIRLSGFEPNVDIPIKVTGLRPGEKLYEELLVAEEGLSKTIHDEIMVTKIMDFDAKEVNKDLELLRNIVDSKEVVNNGKIKKIIKKIVPTFIEETEHTKKMNKHIKTSEKIQYVITVDKETGESEIEKK